MADKQITWDAPKLARFKTVYSDAVKDKLQEFWFEGDFYVLGYAKYLIEYLESKLKHR